jgi:hypothetical protein
MVHEGGWRIDFDPHTNTVTAHDPDGKQHPVIGTPRAHSP